MHRCFFEFRQQTSIDCFNCYVCFEFVKKQMIYCYFEKCINNINHNKFQITLTLLNTYLNLDSKYLIIGYY